jgi:GH24 family phage-related lysozyme (muramidase)
MTATSDNNDHLYPEKRINELEHDLQITTKWMWLFAIFFGITFCLRLYPLLKANKISYEQQVSVSKSGNNKAADSILQYQYNKQLCITNIMLSEDFSSTVYKCPAGFNTIGFGHQVKPTDKIPNKIDFKTGYIILESDFNGCIAYARELGYEKDTPKQLAVAHAIYCLGIGTVGNISDFKNDIMKYVYYHKPNGAMVQSEQIKSARIFEKNMFEKEY